MPVIKYYSEHGQISSLYQRRFYFYKFFVHADGGCYIMRAAALVGRVAAVRFATAYSVWGYFLFCDMSQFHPQMAPLWH